MRASRAPRNQPDGSHEPGTQERSVSKRNWMVLWVIGSIITLAIGYLGGLLVRTPLDEATKNAATQINATAQVTSHEFKPEQVRLSGSVHKGRAVKIPEFALPGGETPIVTQRVAKQGETLASGETIMYLAGQPVLALNLPFELYRDLKPGHSGDDVEALQEELKRLGHYNGVIDGEYGPGVAAAVRSLYSAAGAAAPKASTELADSVNAAQESLTQAQHEATSSKDDDEESSDSSGKAATSSQLQKLRNELTKAQQAADTPLPKHGVITIPRKKIDVIKMPTVGTDLAESPDALKLRSQGSSVTGRMSILEAESFAEGDTVTVSVQTQNNTTAQGKLTSISDFKEGDEAEQLTPGYDFTITLDNDQAAEFSDGDTVNIINDGQDISGTTSLAVPVTAIRQDNGGNYVYVVDSQSHANTPETYTRVDVTPGIQQEGWVDVSSSTLTEGQYLVLGGQQ